MSDKAVEALAERIEAVWEDEPTAAESELARLAARNVVEAIAHNEVPGVTLATDREPDGLRVDGPSVAVIVLGATVAETVELADQVRGVLTEEQQQRVGMAYVGSTIELAQVVQSILPDHNGLRILTCWSAKPPVHTGHTHRVKDERYWCPGYPSDPRHKRGDVITLPGQPSDQPEVRDD